MNATATAAGRSAHTTIGTGGTARLIGTGGKGRADHENEMETTAVGGASQTDPIPTDTDSPCPVIHVQLLHSHP